MKKVEDFKSERELQEDLAEFLRDRGDLTFTEIQIPGMNSSRADVIAMTPYRYSTKNIRLYEVKLTKSVWKADNKYQKYLDCCNTMYIACPKGVIKKSEVPEEIGLITRNDNGWRVIKSPRLNINPSKQNVDFILSLLYRGLEEGRHQRELRERIIAESNVKSEKQAEKIGWELARRISDAKESQVERWVGSVWDIFEKYGFERPENIISSGDRWSKDRVNLPCTYELENMLDSANGLITEVNTLKKIGKFLSNLDLDEASKSFRGSRGENRKDVLEMIEKCESKRRGK